MKDVQNQNQPVREVPEEQINAYGYCSLPQCWCHQCTPLMAPVEEDFQNGLLTEQEKQDIIDGWVL